MRMGKLTYPVVKVKKFTFTETGLIRLDISLVEGDQYTILHLKQTKNNMEQIKI